MVCDNQLFIKPTDAGRAFIKNVKEAPPYPGAKLYFLVDEGFEDKDWISELVRITAKELPAVKPVVPVTKPILPTAKPKKRKADVLPLYPERLKRF